MKQRSRVYRDLSESLFKGLVAFLTLITYLSETRPSICSAFGEYFAGLLDGILVAIIALVTFFCLLSNAK